MTNKRLNELTLKIYGMTLDEVDDYRRVISTSTADARSKAYLYQACDGRERQLYARTNVIATNGDLDDVGI